jgi:hypothetical protein
MMSYHYTEAEAEIIWGLMGDLKFWWTMENLLEEMDRREDAQWEQYQAEHGIYDQEDEDR